MIKKTVSFLLILSIQLVTVSGVPTRGQASQTKQLKRIEKVKSQVTKASQHNDIIKVKLNSGTTYQGSVNQLTNVNFVIVDASGTSHSVNYEEVNSVGGKGYSSGWKIAIGAAIGAGAVLAVLAAIAASDN
ncbi:MAG: hypothetical protein KA831_06415 [Pyrinomonadaceae bacterium]|nr:hypothetical protein [Pyrinomonadaceae bacterium]